MEARTSDTQGSISLLTPTGEGAAGTSRGQGRRPVVSYVARVCVTGVLVAFAFRRVDFSSVMSVLTGVDLTRFVLSMVAFAGAQLLFAKRTQMLLMLQNMPATVRNIFAVNVASAFYTLILPTSLAGGLVRWHRMSSVDGERAEALSVLVLERILDNYSWLILLCAASASLAFRGVVPLWAGVASLAFLGVVGTAGWLVVVVVRSGMTTRWLDSRQRRFVPRSISARLNNVVRALRNGLAEPGQFAEIAGLSFALNAVFQVVIYHVLRAFVPAMAFDQFLLVNVLLTIVVQLPITVAGIGLNETLFGRVLPMLGMNSIAALSVGVAGSTLNVIWALIGGGLELVGLGQYRKPAGVDIARP